MSTKPAEQASPTIFGHPTGLFVLFFAEMWERFSYYGMRALLLFYMMKGFLGYGDNEAYKVYGAYTALVYMTPFFGGMLADRLLGARRAVVLGGLLMAAGHLFMTIEVDYVFFSALALLICGNGFFKPNISTIVGSLYPEGSPKRDGGFTLFYMGINLGAAMSPLLCGYIGETYGWHYGFGLATIGMLLGLAVFIIPSILSQALTIFCALSTALMLGASFFLGLEGTSMMAANGLVILVLFAAAVVAFVELRREEDGEPPLFDNAVQVSKWIGMALILGGSVITSIGLFVLTTNPLLLIVNGFIGIALTSAGVVGFLAVLRGGLPEGAGFAKDPAALRKPIAGFLPAEIAVYLGTLAVIPAVSVMVWMNRAFRVIPESVLDPMANSDSTIMQLVGTLLGEVSTPAGLILLLTGLVALGYLLWESFRATLVERHRLWVVLVLMFFSLLFWAFFEQAGSSINNFTDRNVDRVTEERQLTDADVGQNLTIDLSQEQLGHVNADPALAKLVNTALKAKEKAEDKEPAEHPYRMKAGDPLNLTALDALRANQTHTGVKWKVGGTNVGMGIGGSSVPASTLQAANPIYIIIFGLVFTGLWGFLGERKLEPSTPVKFALGILQLGLGFIVLWLAAGWADARGIVGMEWLLLAYLLITTGELCLSPVGLSMVTKLSPTRLVSTTMGAWFLATAFSNYLAAIIATFTGVSHGGGGNGAIPIPIETVDVYGGVFGTIGAAAIACAVICLALAPLLRYGMHEGEDGEEGEAATEAA